MSDRMMPVPFGELLEKIIAERKQYDMVFGAPLAPISAGCYKNDFADIEMPFGPAAGPHTQLAQNIAAAYAAGARFFELKTVQIIDGEDLKVNKPCISVPDECYNIEWSTELTVQQAFEEYVKAYFLLKFMAVEFGLGNPGGFSFNMSVGYDLAGIKSAKINDFIDQMIDAGDTAVYRECYGYLEKNLNSFEHFGKDDLQSIGTKIADSLTLSTMHGCPAGEIEKIAAYLMKEKKLPLYIKLNPTLLGYENVRDIFAQKGYDYIELIEQQFTEDLQFDDAVPMIKRLQAQAQQLGQFFGVKLTNTLPVKSKGMLPDAQMYLSGKPLFLLAISTAAKVSKSCSALPISFSGGLDAHNMRQVLAAGIFPLTMAAVLLKPSGYKSLSSYAKIFAAQMDYPALPDAGDIAKLAEAAMADAYYDKKNLKQKPKTEKLPVFDCRTCGLCVNVCPNRANIIVPGAADRSAKRQIIHIDAYCNECGNCAGFCPYDGRPYRDKFTVFNTIDEFLSSSNDGVCRRDDFAQVRFKEDLSGAYDKEISKLTELLKKDCRI